MDQQYQIVFKGETVAGVDASTAKGNLERLLNDNNGIVETVVDGKPLVLKSGVDARTAQKYQLALNQAGIVIHIEPLPECEAPHGDAAFKD